MRIKNIKTYGAGPYRRINSLPALEDLLILHKKDPAGLYKAAVKLRVDRERLEDDVLVPARRAIAEAINLRTILEGKDPIVEDDAYSAERKDEWAKNAINGLMHQITLVELALLEYESKDALQQMGILPNDEEN